MIALLDPKRKDREVSSSAARDSELRDHFDAMCGNVTSEGDWREAWTWFPKGTATGNTYGTQNEFMYEKAPKGPCAS
jgi:hypothetical protein